MIERRTGRVVNVSSVGGRITLPYFGVYNSTKYAVEALSDALRYELRPFGIDVVADRARHHSHELRGHGGLGPRPVQATPLRSPSRSTKRCRSSPTGSRRTRS